MTFQLTVRGIDNRVIEVSEIVATDENEAARMADVYCDNKFPNLNWALTSKETKDKLPL
jgi:hypothetical protein